MGFSKFVLPSLSVGALGSAERLMVASIFFVQIAFLIIRRPLFFEQSLLDASVRIFGLFLTSPLAITAPALLFLGYLATGVVIPGRKSSERWNIPLALVATGIAITGGLISAVLFIPGLLLSNIWGYGLVAVSFWLGASLPGQSKTPAEPLQSSSPQDRSRLPTRREVLRSLLSVPPAAVVGPAVIISALSIEDNHVFQTGSRAGKLDFAENLPPDNSIKVARLSSGLIRYRDMNPQGRKIVLGFHGFQESLYEFPSALKAKLEELDIRGIFIERPGIGPVSTPWPGHDFADWADLVEEFDQKVLGGQPISIVGHSAGGVYALACAKLASVRAIALVSSPAPITYSSFLRTLHLYDLEWQGLTIGVELFPQQLVTEVQRMNNQIVNDWKRFRNGMLKTMGQADKDFVMQNEEAFHQNMAVSVLQGAEPTIDDFRRVLSPWLLTLADTTRIPIAIFRGADDRLVPPEVTDLLHQQFVPHATREDFPDMGHQPGLKHYERVFEVIGNLHIQEGHQKHHRALFSAA